MNDTPTQPPESDSEPASELAQLLSAARAHLRRRRALGERALRVATSAPSSAPSAAGASSTPPPAPSARPTAAAHPGSSAPTPPRVPPPPRPAPSPAPARAPLPPRQPAPVPTAAPATNPTGDAITSAPLRTAEEVRQTAAACGDLSSLRAAVARCHACPLAATRTQTVFSDGPARARILFVGEAPGASDERSGIPFTGESGALLTDIIEKGMGLRRGEVAIADLLKCRPPEDRAPSAEELRTCTPWLERQIELLGPEVLVPLGKSASNHLLGIAEPDLRSFGSLRERVHERGGRKLVPTYHPAYLLATPEAKKDCWKDIQLAMGLLGIQPRRRV